MGKLLLLAALIALVFLFVPYDVALLFCVVVVSFIVLALLLYVVYFITCDLVGFAYEHRLITAIVLIGLFLITFCPFILLILAFLAMLYKVTSKAYKSEYASDLREKYVPKAAKKVGSIPIIGSFFLGYWLASQKSNDNSNIEDYSSDDAEPSPDSGHDGEPQHEPDSDHIDSSLDEDYSPCEYEYYDGGE